MREVLKAIELIGGGGGVMAMVCGGAALVLGFTNAGAAGIKYGAVAFIIGIAVKLFRRLILPD
ncbi:MAG TPA: hypothetical protein PLD73_05515 [Candidatus Hydrogenedentes bacterium]|jgi:hypothetical protein|nr:hypothetical protein [Candidatus Hydrogenedentota bacterium]HPK00340.1 hypothetical protein [Candidatus Hydrogenedentota bacterium]